MRALTNQINIIWGLGQRPKNKKNLLKFLTKSNRRNIIFLCQKILVNKPFSRFLHTHQIDCPRRTKQCQEKEYLNLLFILL